MLPEQRELIGFFSYRVILEYIIRKVKRVFNDHGLSLLSLVSVTPATVRVLMSEYYMLLVV